MCFPDSFNIRRIWCSLAQMLCCRFASFSHNIVCLSTIKKKMIPNLPMKVHEGVAVPIADGFPTLLGARFCKKFATFVCRLIGPLAAHRLGFPPRVLGFLVYALPHGECPHSAHQRSNDMAGCLVLVSRIVDCIHQIFQQEFGRWLSSDLYCTFELRSLRKLAWRQHA